MKRVMLKRFNWLFVFVFVISTWCVLTKDDVVVQSEQTPENAVNLPKAVESQSSENSKDELKNLNSSTDEMQTNVSSQEIETNIINSTQTEIDVVTNKTTKLTKVNCKSREFTVENDTVVKVVNSSVMLNVVVPESNITANECALVLFYGSWCHFSAMAAPHYNALARLFPTFHLFAVNAIKHNGLNTRYGIVAIPTLLLFHNGRAIAKYNETVYSLDNFIHFVEKYTNTEAQGIANVTSADFYGPLPSEPSLETDYVLWLAWIFILLCATFSFVKSSLCHKVVEIIRNNWREAEAQHEHGD